MKSPLNLDISLFPHFANTCLVNELATIKYSNQLGQNLFMGQ